MLLAYPFRSTIPSPRRGGGRGRGLSLSLIPPPAAEPRLPHAPPQRNPRQRRILAERGELLRLDCPRLVWIEDRDVRSSPGEQRARVEIPGACRPHRQRGHQR